MTVQSDGGRARAAKLSPERRSEIARAAARARWDTEAGATRPPAPGHEPAGEEQQVNEKAKESEPLYVTVKRLKAAIENAPDDALVVVDAGHVLAKPVRTAEAFRGKLVESAGGDAVRLGGGGRDPLLVLST